MKSDLLNRVIAGSRKTISKDVVVYFYKDINTVLPFVDMFTSVRNITGNQIFTSKKGIFWIGNGHNVTLTPSSYMEEPYFSGRALHYKEGEEKEVRDLLNRPEIKDMLKVGVGWGAHLLAVENGATIIQSLEGHRDPHPVMVEDIGVITSHANHFQAISPHELDSRDYVVLAWAFCGTGRMLAKTKFLQTHFDYEIIYFPKTKSLCIEGTFLFAPPTDDYTIAIRKIIANLIENPNHYGE